MTTENTPVIRWWDTELPTESLTGARLYGGLGCSREYLVGHAWADSRVQSVFGGTTEIQKEIIGRSLGL